MPPTIASLGGGAWSAPRPPGEATHRSLRKIRDALNLYWVSLILSFFASLIGTAYLGAWTGGGLASFTSAESANGARHSALLSSSLAISGIVDLLGLGILIITIVSWVRWRDAATQLIVASSEFGAAAVAAAHGVREDISRVTYTFIGIIVSSIAFVGAIVILLIGAVLANLNTTSRTVNTTPLLSAGLVTEIATLSIVASILFACLEVVLYLFACRSHVRSIDPFGTPEARRRVGTGRTVVLVGAALSFVGTLGLLVPYAGFLSLVPAILLVVGYFEIRSAFDDTLSRPLVFHPPADRSTPFRA